MFSRWSKRIITLLCSLAVLGFAVVIANGASVGVTADQALKNLMDGNQRYVAGKMTNQKRSDATTRATLTKTQKPYAIILSCSDSRVPPEIIFDEGLGEIFVIRVAGNVADPVVLGSIEYAAEHIGTPLVMVLGHKSCGAVTAAVKATGKPEGNLGQIVTAIQPAVEQAKKETAGKPEAEVIDKAIDDNIDLVAASLTKQSEVLKGLVAKGELKIVKAKYDLEDGKVSLLK